jgi:D-glycero-beta-D-manno-heptose-7-phosphate kinase
MTAYAPLALVHAEQLAATKVLVVGDAMLDRYWFGAVDRISPEAPVPVVRITREEERLGGAANVALNVKTLGAQAILMTVVGDDEPAKRLKQLLEMQGVDTLLGHDPKLYTTVKLRVIGRAQQLIRVDFENEPDHEVLQSMLSSFESTVLNVQAVLFSDYGKGGLSHISRMIELASLVKQPILIDPKGCDYSRYAGATLITPNRSELAQVIGSWDNDAQLQERAHNLRAQHRLQNLLLTRSEEGMTLFDEQGQLHVPAQAREVFDVTGAGDTVIATMAALMGSGLSVRQAMPIANSAAGIAVSKFGTAAVSFEELFV